jgi:hypothetical protein
MDLILLTRYPANTGFYHGTSVGAGSAKAFWCVSGNGGGKSPELPLQKS